MILYVIRDHGEYGIVEASKYMIETYPKECFPKAEAIAKAIELKEKKLNEINEDIKKYQNYADALTNRLSDMRKGLNFATNRLRVIKDEL